jgi:hypothetical protein
MFLSVILIHLVWYSNNVLSIGTFDCCYIQIVCSENFPTPLNVRGDRITNQCYVGMCAILLAMASVLQRQLMVVSEKHDSSKSKLLLLFSTL